VGPRHVTIIIPALNEEAYIERALDTITPEQPDFLYEIIVVDGGSVDATRALVAARAGRDPRIRLIDNDRRVQAAGVNRAAALAHPDSSVLIRADCHAAYPPGFVARCVERMATTGAQSVVVPMRTTGIGCFQRAVAAVQNSRLGTGGAAHRRGGLSGFVEHGHHAAFDRASFLALGGYDETFSHNEDAEYDYRLGLAGGRVWLDAENPVVYYPRATLTSLARQYFNHGAGRARTFLKHRMRLKPRQLAPVFILAAWGGAILLWPLSWLCAVPAVSYAALCLGWGAVLAVRSRDRCPLAAGIAALAMHAGWAAGFLTQLGRRR